MTYGRTRLLLALVTALSSLPGQATEFRVKAFVAQGRTDTSDLQARTGDRHPLDGDLDLRAMSGFAREAWTGTWHHEVTLEAGDGHALGRVLGLNSTGNGLSTGAGNDDARLLDLTWRLDHGDRHQWVHRVDRLTLQWRSAQWTVTAGREALSLGGGILFHPMDFLNPFAPTSVDKDYKAGEDMVHVHRQLPHGAELSLFAVGRRDAHGNIEADAASFAGRWRGQLGDSEFEVIAARHWEDRVLGTGFRVPLGGALVRADVVATELAEADEVRVSLVVNLDYSFTLRDKTLYAFAEYYHNGFGVRTLEPGRPLPAALTARLARGETHALMRDYAAIGGTFAWHPLVNQTLAVVRNLQDQSMFVQTGVQIDLNDQQRLELGCLLQTGGDGREYGGRPIGFDADGQLVTVGSGDRIYARWTWYPAAD